MKVVVQIPCLNEEATLPLVLSTIPKHIDGVDEIDIVVTPTNDNRSYQVSSEKIRRELGFVPKRTIGDAVTGLKAAFGAGRVPNSMTDPMYYNIKRMQEVRLK